tara:strand:+ start:5040 stop:5357 length:318 start_codon:yes stop_codon:yes gene_type:complete
MVLVGMKDDKPLSVKLFTKNGTEFLSPTQVVQAQPTAIGMDTTIVVFDDSTIRDGARLSEPPKTGTLQRFRRFRAGCLSAGQNRLRRCLEPSPSWNPSYRRSPRG